MKVFTYRPTFLKFAIPSGATGFYTKSFQLYKGDIVKSLSLVADNLDLVTTTQVYVSFSAVCHNNNVPDASGSVAPPPTASVPLLLNAIVGPDFTIQEPAGQFTTKIKQTFPIYFISDESTQCLTITIDTTPLGGASWLVSFLLAVETEN